jgi:putative transcriptional regulator
MRSRLHILMAEHDPPLTQMALIKRSGLGSHTISRLYNNTFQRVDVDTVDRLCGFFDCDLVDLFEMEGKNYD